MYRIIKLSTERDFLPDLEYYTVSKLSLSKCLNLMKRNFEKYTEDSSNPVFPYYDIFNYDVPVIEGLEAFENREDAKDKMQEYIKNSPDCLNITKSKNYITKDRKAYNHSRYINNKDKLKKYYEAHKDKIKEYQSQKYNETKAKLNKLDELLKEKN